MIGATVWDHPHGRVKVAVWDEDGERAIVIAPSGNLPGILDKYQPDEIWQNGDQMELCFTPNCHELVCKSDPCPLCPGCLEEYQQEQRDYQDMRNLRAYVGVIG